MLENTVHINGRIATDLAQHGKGPTKFRLAHGGGGKRKDGSSWPTQFFSVSVWNSALVEGLAKGRSIEIHGKLRDASYIKDGVARSAVEIVADSIVAEPEERPLPPITPNLHGVPITDDDIPF